MTRLLPPFVATVCDRLAWSSSSLPQDSCFKLLHHQGLVHQDLIHQALHFIKPLRASAFGLCTRPARHFAQAFAQAFGQSSTKLPCGVFIMRRLSPFAARSGSKIAKQQPQSRGPRRGVAHLW
jgi:hypothetical protein